MQIFVFLILLLLPAAALGEEYYDALVSSAEVYELYDHAKAGEKKDRTLYKMEIVRVTEGYLRDRISEVHLVTAGGCTVSDGVTKAILVIRGNNQARLFFEDGNACGIKEIFPP